MQVHQIDTGRRREVRRFLGVPFDLYRGSEQWVPLPFAFSAVDLNRKRHPFYEHSAAAFFVAEESGRAVGRIAALDHRVYNEHHRRRDAFFCHFDAADDDAVSAALFDAACGWARNRGLERIIGPRGLLVGDSMGLLVDGFEHRAAMGANYNHPYYARLVTGYGFKKETDFLTGRLVRGDRLPDQFFALADAAREQLGLRVEAFTSRRSIRPWEQAIGDAYNESFSSNWEFAPVTTAEISLVADRQLSSAGSASAVVLIAGDEVAGFMFLPVDITAALQRARGRLYPLAWVSLLRAIRRSRWANVNGIGLRPRYQGTGAITVLFAHLVRLSADHARFDGADLVQIEEGNTRMMQSLSAIGVPFHKRHRIYRKAL